MKRFVISIIVLLILISSVTAAFRAEGEAFYCEYSQNSSSSSRIYIDIYSGVGVTAAVLELNYDDSVVSLRSLTAGEKNGTVRYTDSDGVIRAAFAYDGEVKGRLLRACFSADSKFTTDFVLHPIQATDDSLTLMSGLNDYTLTLEIDGSGKAKTTAKDSTGRVSSSAVDTSNRSSRTDNDDYDSDHEYRTYREKNVNVLDLHKDDPFSVVLITVGCVIIIAAFAFGLFILVRKLKKDKARMKSLSEDKTDNEDEIYTADADGEFDLIADFDQDENE